MNNEPFSVSSHTIRQFFSDISSTYDWINVLMTGGLDSYWRKRAARLAITSRVSKGSAEQKTSRRNSEKWLDICAGTGQMTLSLARRARADTIIVAMDFCSPMIRLLNTTSGKCSIHRCLGDVGIMPFPDDCFDLVTIAFATRNLHTNREKLLHCFGEVKRVLKPGGRFMNLETSQPSSSLVRKLFHGFIGMTVHFLGMAVSGSSSPYQYLASSIQTFYPPAELSNLLVEAGFKNVSFFPMTGGSVAAHLAWKR
ncbi:MAG: class I SAM-dependent methyltransferase [Candidatus Riflebacteria bacterium]|nr:class I SAM-dependent methyltransferase [Candidatus Riflebacteria bacterium]